MPKYFREVNKHISGDETIAARYMGVARSFLGGLVEMSGELVQNSRHIVLPDGVRIGVSFRYDLASIEIDASGIKKEESGGCSSFLETGGIEHHGTYTIDGIEESQLYYGGFIELHLHDDTVYLDSITSFRSETPTTSIAFSFGIQPGDTPDEIEAKKAEFIAQRRRTQFIKPSMFCGKTRLLVQSLMGSHLDKLAFAGTLSNPAVTFRGVRIDTSSGVYVAPDNSYWLITPGSSLASARKISFDACGNAFVALAEGEDAVTKSMLEAYAFTHIVGFGDEVVSEFDTIEGSPIAYGWHFNVAGDAATITTIADATTGQYDIARTYALTADFTTVPTISVARTEESGLKLPTSNGHLFYTTSTGVQEKYRTRYTLSSSDTVNAPVYSYYKNDGELVVCRFKFNYVSAGLEDVGAYRVLGVCGTGTDVNEYYRTGSVTYDKGYFVGGNDYVAHGYGDYGFVHKYTLVVEDVGSVSEGCVGIFFGGGALSGCDGGVYLYPSGYYHYTSYLAKATVTVSSKNGVTRTGGGFLLIPLFSATSVYAGKFVGEHSLSSSLNVAITTPTLTHAQDMGRCVNNGGSYVPGGSPVGSVKYYISTAFGLPYVDTVNTVYGEKDDYTVKIDLHHANGMRNQVTVAEEGTIYGSPWLNFFAANDSFTPMLTCTDAYNNGVIFNTPEGSEGGYPVSINHFSGWA